MTPEAEGSQSTSSALYVVTCIAVVAATVALGHTHGPLGLLILPALILQVAVLLYGFYPLIEALKKRHRLAAVLALGGMALILGGVWTIPALSRSIDVIQFQWNRAKFDEMVAAERRREPAGQPIRMVVQYDDQSVFVGVSSFVYTLYDETDQANAMVSGYWPCPGSVTGIISMDGSGGTPKGAWHISGHYYLFGTS